MVREMSCGDETNEERERSDSGAERREVGCCGDVPEGVSNKAVLGGNAGKRKERLLEWLKSSQTKREENNRQVLARWIDMVDHGVIDLASVYPSKPPSVKTEALPQTCFSPIPSTKPTTPMPTNVSPQYYSPNYYGVPHNWFASAHSTAMYSPQSYNVYSGSYCPSNYYQYVPYHQQCTLCPSYIVPNNNEANVELNCSNNVNESNLNINSEKWFDSLEASYKRNEDADKKEDS